jgi:hypothetical protein
MDFAIYAIHESQSIKKMCYGFIAYIEIEDFFHNCETCYTLKGYDI